MSFKKKNNRVINRIKFLLEPIKRYRKDELFNKEVKYASYFEKLKIKDNVILYEAFHGKSMVDNPYAIFKYLIDHPEYKNFVHVWVLNSTDNYYYKKYKNRSNVLVVAVNSDDYIKWLAQAKYLINNVTFPAYFQKKEEQVYINTWHGTPIKTLGKDMKGKVGQHKNIQRNFMHCDFIINPNKFTSDIIVQSHDLKGLYNGYISDEGYPRVDLTINANKQQVKSMLQEIIKIDPSKKIVLYAPTWRGEVNKVNNINEEMFLIINKMYSQMPEGYQLILKVHSLMYKYIESDERFEQICIPDWVDTNELLSITDILITDYSSIFFDYLITRKPILYFVYDQKIYENERGLYLDLKEMPGPLCYSVEDIVSEIVNIENVKKVYGSKYEKAINEYCYNDNGKATERFVDIILKGNHTKNVYKITDNNKKNILVYAGGFLSNGITSSVINLLNKIDYSRYNIAIIDKGEHDQESSQNLKKLNKNVKIFYRVGRITPTLKEYYGHKLIDKSGLKNGRYAKFIPKSLYKKEVSRLFGNAKFDIAVDFSGYVPFWSLLFSSGEFENKVIYQHNDMHAEYYKKIKGKYKHKSKLNIIFPLYKFFDKVVAVSKDTRDLNVTNLKDYIPEEKAVYVHNCIDYEKVIMQVKEGEIYTHSNRKEYLLSENVHESGLLELKGVEIPRKENVNFVTMGRLSPEKDQKKLIEAFAKVAEEYENIRLYIIGDGVLKYELINLVNNFGLSGKVFFTGQMQNPFYLISHCDCFVLSSNHEGQPMVLLEALILAKPIIATDIAGSRSVLEDGYGELVENSELGLVRGLTNFMENIPEFKKFNYIDYNEIAINMFYKEVCLEK